MKNNIFILFYLFVLPTLAISQNSWTFDDYESRESDWEYIVDVKQLGDSKLVSLSMFFTKQKDQVLRIHDSLNGCELLQTKFSNDSTSFIYLFVNEDIKEIYMFGIDKRGFLLLKKWDYNLNLKESIRIPIPKNRYIKTYKVNRFDDEFVCLAGTYVKSEVSEEKTFFIRLDLEGNLKLIKELNIQGGVKNIVKKVNNKGYWGIGHIFYSFDTTLNVESEKFYLLDHEGGGISWHGKILDDSTYILGIPCDVSGVEYGTRLIKANLDMTIRNQAIHTFPGKYTTLSLRGFDFYYKDALYLAAMDYWDLTYFDISKFDEDLNLIWRKHIRLNENDTYYMFSIEALSDRGAVICGNKHRYNMEGKRDSSRAFMLKIAADGSIVSNKEVDKSGWDITVFPNPSQGDFKIEIGGNAQNAKLRIFDLQGKEVKVFDKLLSGTNHLNMYELSQGMYIWKLEKDNKIIGSGKWVKK